MLRVSIGRERTRSAKFGANVLVRDVSKTYSWLDEEVVIWLSVIGGRDGKMETQPFKSETGTEASEDRHLPLTFVEGECRGVFRCL